MKKIFILLAVLIILAGASIALSLKNWKEDGSFSIVADNLEIPWAIAFLPDKSILITERPGRVRVVNTSGQLEPKPVAVIEKVKHTGEGGLLGITIDPDFVNNRYVYLYYTYSSTENNTLNRVVRMTYVKQQLKDEKVIVDRIPGASNHNGGRIKFGPDNNLYITTGDAENPSQAQDVNSLAGKILRVKGEGDVEVFSYGHRNPQGLAWDSRGQLWATEHGRSGGLSGFDEINLIQKGKNYGWPLIQGDERMAGMETPKLHSGGSATWAPAGAVYADQSVLFAGLRGQTLYKVSFTQERLELEEYFKGEFGRLRDVSVGPDNMFYITTSNRDGRGNTNPGDDKVIKVKHVF